MDPKHECGGRLRAASERVTVHVRGKAVIVDERFLRCDRCGEELVPLGEVGEVERQAASTLREREGRISPKRILALRESLAVTQDFFEKAVGLAPKTVVRWETGKVFPSKAVDALLRLLERDRTAFAFLCKENGQELPDGWK